MNVFKKLKSFRNIQLCHLVLNPTWQSYQECLRISSKKLCRTYQELSWTYLKKALEILYSSPHRLCWVHRFSNILSLSNIKSTHKQPFWSTSVVKPSRFWVNNMTWTLHNITLRNRLVFLVTLHSLIAFIFLFF